MADQLRDSGEQYSGKPLYVAGYGTAHQCSVFWDGRGRWMATNGRIHGYGATAEEAAREFTELWQDIHG